MSLIVSQCKFKYIYTGIYQFVSFQGHQHPQIWTMDSCCDIMSISTQLQTLNEKWYACVLFNVHVSQAVHRQCAQFFFLFDSIRYAF